MKLCGAKRDLRSILLLRCLPEQGYLEKGIKGPSLTEKLV